MIDKVKSAGDSTWSELSSEERFISVWEAAAESPTRAQSGITVKAGPESTLVIQIPAELHGERRLLILDTLQMIYDSADGAFDWAVDLAVVKRMPVWLLGGLNAYREDLEAQERHLVLRGVSPGLLPARSMQRLRELFVTCEPRSV